MTHPALAALRAKPYLLSITANYFLQFVEHLVAFGEGHLSISDIEVTGTVDFVGRTLPNGFCMERTYFRDPVRLGNCQFNNRVRFRNCAFDRGLDLSNGRLENGISFESCTFGLDGARIAGIVLNLTDTKVVGNVALSSSNAYGCVSAERLSSAGNVYFSACTIEGDSRTGAPVLDLSNANIVGNIVFESNDARNFSTDVEGIKSAALTVVRHPRRSMFVDRSARSCVALRNTRATDIGLSHAKFGGDVDFTFVKCRSVTSDAAYFTARPDERLQWPANHTAPADLALDGARIEGDLVLSGGELSYVHLHGISISGSFTLIDGKSGQIEIEDSITWFGAELHIKTSELGNFFMSAWHCRDFLSLHATRISGAGNTWGYRGVHMYSARIDRSICFWPGSRITRQLQTAFLDSPDREPPQKILVIDGQRKAIQVEDGGPHCGLLNRWNRGLSISGGINIQRCIVGEHVILTGVTVRDERPDKSGRIDLLHSTVTGNVTFGSPISYATEPHRSDQILNLSASYFLAREAFAQASSPTAHTLQISATSRIAAATCDGVDMRGLVASSVELSGLRVRPPTDAGDVGAARVDLHQAKIDGKLTTFARAGATVVADVLKDMQRIVPPQDGAATGLPRNALLPERVNRRRQVLSLFFGTAAIDSISASLRRRWVPARVGTSAMIPGALDLQHARIGELVISDESFCEASRSCKAVDRGIVLDYANINKLYVARNEAAMAAHNGFPVPLSLLDLTVKTWFLEAAGHASSSEAYISRECTESEPYLDLLDNDGTFRMSSYLAVEQSLRNRGLEKEATDIFVAGRYRDFRTDSQSKAGEEQGDWSWMIWRPGDGRPRTSTIRPLQWLRARFPRLRLPILRLRRPRREYVGFALCILWIAAALVIGVQFVQHPRDLDIYFGGAGLAVLFLALSNAPRAFIDQLHWSLLDYGTSAARLAFVILGLAFVSLLLVSSERENFMPTLAASTLEAQRQNANISAPIYAEQRQWDNTGSPTADRWPFGERIWMTLRYHMPLVGAVISDEWQPADRPLIIRGVTGVLGEHERPRWWPFDRWVRARDWFGFMLWINWVLWPLFLPSIIRQLTRDRQS